MYPPRRSGASNAATRTLTRAVDPGPIVESSRANCSNAPVVTAHYRVALILTESGPLAAGSPTHRRQELAQALQRALDADVLVAVRYDALDFEVTSRKRLARGRTQYTIEIVMNEDCPPDMRSDSGQRELVQQELEDAIARGFFESHSSSPVEAKVLMRHVLDIAPAGAREDVQAIQPGRLSAERTGVSDAISA